MTDRSDPLRPAAPASHRVQLRAGRTLLLAAVAIMMGTVAVYWSEIARFWPQPVIRVEQIDGTVLAGKVLRTERFRPDDADLAGLTPEHRARLAADGGQGRRVLYRRLDLDDGGGDSVWIADFTVSETTRPLDLFLIEQEDSRPVAGRIAGLILNDRAIAESAITLPRLRDAHRAARARRSEMDALVSTPGADATRLATMAARDRGDRIVVEDVNGRSAEIPLSAIVRFLAPNNIGLLDRIRVYAARWVTAFSTGRSPGRGN